MVDENRGETNVEYLTQFDTLGGLHEIDNGGYQVSDEDRREIMNALSSDRKDISANNKAEEKKLDGFIAKHPDSKVNTEDSVVYSGRLQDFDIKEILWDVLIILQLQVNYRSISRVLRMRRSFSKNCLMLVH